MVAFCADPARYAQFLAYRDGKPAGLAEARWARACGCRELASDALLENQASHAAHRALGFVETERVVFFRKPL